MDGVARMVASGAYGATGLAGPALGTLAAAISASTAVTEIADVTVATLAPAGVERSSAPKLGRARPESGTVTHMVDGSTGQEEEEALN